MKGLNYTSIFSELNKIVFIVFSLICCIPGVIYLIYQNLDKQLIDLYILLSPILLFSLMGAAIIKFVIKSNNKFSTLFVFFIIFNAIWYFCFYVILKIEVLFFVAAFLIMHFKVLHRSEFNLFINKWLKKH